MEYNLSRLVSGDDGQVTGPLKHKLDEEARKHEEEEREREGQGNGEEQSQGAGGRRNGQTDGDVAAEPPAAPAGKAQEPGRLSAVTKQAGRCVWHGGEGAALQDVCGSHDG